MAAVREARLRTSLFLKIMSDKYSQMKFNVLRGILLIKER